MASNPVMDVATIGVLAGGGFLLYRAVTTPQPSQAKAPAVTGIPVTRSLLTPSPAAEGATAIPADNWSTAPAGAGRSPATTYAIGQRYQVAPGLTVAFGGYDEPNRLAAWYVVGGTAMDVYSLAWDRKPTDYDWSAGYPAAATPAPAAATERSIGATVARFAGDIASSGPYMIPLLPIAEQVLPMNLVDKVRIQILGGLGALNLTSWLR